MTAPDNPAPDCQAAPSSSAGDAARSCARTFGLRPPVTEQTLLALLRRSHEVSSVQGLLEDGRVDLDDSGRHRVVVRSDVPVSRRTWTLAHELGHLYAHSRPPADEERWCNAFAAELLMPRRWIETFPEHAQDLAALEHVAGTARQSRSAALARLRRVAGWQAALLTFTRDERQWVLLSVTGLEHVLADRLFSTPDTGAALIGRQQSGKTQLPLRAGRTVLTVAAECRSTDHYAWALLATPAVNSVRRAFARGSAGNEQPQGEPRPPRA